MGNRCRGAIRYQVDPLAIATLVLAATARTLHHQKNQNRRSKQPRPIRQLLKGTPGGNHIAILHHQASNHGGSSSSGTDRSDVFRPDEPARGPAGYSSGRRPCAVTT